MAPPPLPPGFQLDGAPPAPGGPVTIGTPRPPAPPSAAEQQRLDLARRADARAQAEFERRQQQPPAAAQTQQQNRAAVQAGNMDALVNQINRVQELYEQNLEGQGIGSLLEYLPGWMSSGNARFNSAGAGMGEVGLAAFRVPGVGSQSDAELRQFVAANTPRASDNDAAIEEKLNNLRNRVNEVREALGLPPAPWRGAPQRDPAAASGTLMRGDQAPEQQVSPLTPAQAEAYDAFVRRNPQASPEQISAFFAGMGLNIENAADVARARDAGAGVRPGAEAMFSPPDISDVRGHGGAGESIDAGFRGAADLATFGHVDEIRALRDTAFGDGTYRENLHRQRAIDEFDIEHNFGERLAGQFAGAIALPSRAPAAFATGGARAGARQLGIEGGTIGGLYGFGSAEGGLGDRLAGAGIGASIGAPAGFLTGRTLGSLMTPRAAPAVPQERAEIIRTMNDAEGLGINMMPADVAGPTVRRATGVAYQLPLSTALVTRGARRVNEQSQGARDNIATGVGAAVEPEAAGMAASQGGRSFIARTSARGGNLYDRAETLAAGAQIQPSSAVAALDRNIGELSQVPGGAEGLGTLQQLREQLAGGTFTVQGIRGMRSALRDQFASQGLRGSDLERRVGQVIDAATDDIVTGLRAQGRGGAARAYQVADRYWRNRLRTIDDVLDPIIGNGRSGEQIVANLQAAGRGNSARLRSFMQTLQPDEQSTVRASLINQLGRTPPGQQNAAGDAFSLNVFLTHWNQLQPGAREAMFGREAAQGLQRLANVAGLSRQAQRYQNFSQTGAIVGGVATVGHAFAEPMTAILSGLTQIGGGALLASPRFARWLARAPRHPRAMPRYIGRLTQIARTEPAIAADIAGLQQRLSQAFSQSPMRAAAEEEVNRR